MSAWMLWLAAAGALVVLEMFSGTFYLLMLALGAAAGAVAALSGLSHAMQFLLAALAGVTATACLHRSRWGRVNRNSSDRNPDINLDIGQTLSIDAWNGDGRTARARYRGAEWDVALEQDGPALPGRFVIREVRGNLLLVAPDTSSPQARKEA